ncbi:MAG: hypothetical protein C0478_08470 [Planctomyces sp.]|nr:hypothetical protein [Planctomyces sp.]
MVVICGLGVSTYTFELAAGADRHELPKEVILCGFGELTHIDLAQLHEAKLPVKPIWSWQGVGREDLPEARRKQFGTTDEVKLVAGGTQLLVTSSGSGCSLIQRVASDKHVAGSVLWSATVPNAHSIEMLPEGKVVVAASTAKTGNKLLVFDVTKGDQPIAEVPLYSAHGVVWDKELNRLFAVGFKEINRYEVVSTANGGVELKLEESYPLPDEGGHDLQPVPGTPDLVVSTHDHVHLFDRLTKIYRKHPILGDRAHIKCVSVRLLPNGIETLFVQASDEHWWSHEIGTFVEPQGGFVPGKETPLPLISTYSLGKGGVYKARWIPLAP